MAPRTADCVGSRALLEALEPRLLLDGVFNPSLSVAAMANGQPCDGNPAEDVFGRYIEDIPIDGFGFSATPEGAGASEIDEVLFAIDGSEYAAAQVGSEWLLNFDIHNLERPADMSVWAVDSDTGSTSAPQPYTLEVVPLPEWLETESPDDTEAYEEFDLEMEYDGDKYTFDGQYTMIDWNYPTPELPIPLLNDQYTGFQVGVDFDFYSELTGSVSDVDVAGFTRAAILGYDLWNYQFTSSSITMGDGQWLSGVTLGDLEFQTPHVGPSGPEFSGGFDLEMEVDDATLDLTASGTWWMEETFPVASTSITPINIPFTLGPIPLDVQVDVDMSFAVGSRQTFGLAYEHGALGLEGTVEFFCQPELDVTGSVGVPLVFIRPKLGIGVETEFELANEYSVALNPDGWNTDQSVTFSVDPAFYAVAGLDFPLLEWFQRDHQAAEARYYFWEPGPWEWDLGELLGWEKPDLAAENISISGPTPLRSGEVFDADFDLRNLRDEPFVGDTNVVIALSGDGNLDDGDVILKKHPVSYSSASPLDDTDHLSLNDLRVPFDTDSGDYYVLAVVDHPDEITESNEDNNVARTPSRYQVEGLGKLTGYLENRECRDVYYLPLNSGDVVDVKLHTPGWWENLWGADDLDPAVAVFGPDHTPRYVDSLTPETEYLAYDEDMENWWIFGSPDPDEVTFVAWKDGTYAIQAQVDPDAVGSDTAGEYTLEVEIDDATAVPPFVQEVVHGYQPDTNFEVTFSEDVDQTSLSAANIKLVGSQTGSHAWSHSYSPSEYRLVLDPGVDFERGEVVTLTIGTGVTDRTGNGLDGDKDGATGPSYEYNFVVSRDQHDSIDDGIAWLRSVQLSNGSWSNETATTSLAVLAMLNAGYPETDPVVQQGLDYLLTQLHSNGSMGSESHRYTYRTGIGILPFVATHNPDYHDEIAKMRSWLIGSQWDESSYYGSVGTSHSYYGGFGYGNSSRPDLSNTQWALLGIKAADRELGLNASGTYRKCRDYFLPRCQNGDGGSGYRPGRGSIHTMTPASVWSYRLCDVPASDSRVTRGLDWLGSRYSMYSNDGWGRRSDTYYWITFAKSLVMSHKDTLSGHDWYADLSNYIMGRQTSSGRYDGAWTMNGWLSGRADYELNTAYAILAMQTRTIPSAEDLSMSIVLASHADLHVYGPDGRHLGVNYDTGMLERQIPGATLEYYYDENGDGALRPWEKQNPTDYLSIPHTWVQIATLPTLTEGSYRTELVGTSEGSFDVMIRGTDDDEAVTSHSYQGTIAEGQRYSTSTTVTAMEGPVTLLYEEMASLPLMDVTPDMIDAFTQAGQVEEVIFTVNETGGDQTLHGVSLYSSDLTGSGGTIEGSGITFSVNHFDVAPGGSQLVHAYIPVPVGFAGDASGEIIAESTDGGTQTIQTTLSTASVDVSVGRCGYDRRTRQFAAAITATNISQVAFADPKLVITEISDPSVTLANPDGTTSEGHPYIELSDLLSDGQLGPGETASLMVYFNNPNRMIFSFEAEVQGTIVAGSGAGTGMKLALEPMSSSVLELNNLTSNMGTSRRSRNPTGSGDAPMTDVFEGVKPVVRLTPGRRTSRRTPEPVSQLEPVNTTAVADPESSVALNDPLAGEPLHVLPQPIRRTTRRR